MRVLTAGLVVWSAVTPLLAIEPERDFSGSWILVEERSRAQALGVEPEPFLTVAQDARALRCSSAIGGAELSWTYRLDGAESRYALGAESRNSVVKWEGAALLVNTLAPGYTVMDRWRLSDDRSSLTITRHIVRRAGEVEGSLVYRRAGSRLSAPPAAAPSVPQTAPSAPMEAPRLAPRPAAAPSGPGELTVPAGTHVLLELVNSLNTKRSRDGDHVYMRTVVPIAAGGHIAIPRGSTVLGTVTEAKPARGKGDLYIRFDTLTLPDGTTRDLRVRPEDAKEGKIAGAPDHAGDARTVAIGAGIGASIGGLAGAAAGHTGAGLGIGGLAGAAAGLASVFSKKPDVTLPRGTTLELVLDRDLRF